MKSPWSVARVFYPAGDYHHPPSGRLQLRLVRRGSSYAMVDLGAGERRMFTRPGDLLLSLPGKPTAFKIDEGRELLVLQMTSGHATKILAAVGGTLNDLEPLLTRPMRDALIAESLRRLEFIAESETVYRGWSAGVVIATLLRRSKMSSKERTVVFTPRRLGLVLDAIDANLTSTVSVAALARIAGLPERPFARAFKEAMAMPVYQYVLRRRVDGAIELLRGTSLSIAEVAQRSGFSHQAHLTSVLRRLRGKTPGQIRGARVAAADR